jgi:hypothetical protein
MMRPAQVVRAAYQPHPGFKRTDSASRMSAPSSQAGETLSHRPIETFDKRRVQLLASPRVAQHLVSALKGSLRHPPDHFDDALFGRFRGFPFQSRGLATPVTHTARVLLFLGSFPETRAEYCWGMPTIRPSRRGVPAKADNRLSPSAATDQPTAGHASS